MALDLNTLHGFSFHALGGSGRLRIANVPQDVAIQAVVAAVQWLRKVEARYSRFQADSMVSRLNRGEVVEADDSLLMLLDAAKMAHHRTAGRLDATALPLWRLWHDPERVAWPRPDEIERALRRRGLDRVIREHNTVRLPHPGTALDFGCIGKEWCVDQLVMQLERRGLRHFLVELAGDVAARGCQSANHDGWWVHLPGGARAFLLRNAAIATSGHGKRFRWLSGRPVSHLIDAQTGQAASGKVRSVTVAALTCLEAGIAASDAALAENVDTAFARLPNLGGLVRTADNAFFMDPSFGEWTAEVAADAASESLTQNRALEDRA